MYDEKFWNEFMEEKVMENIVKLPIQAPLLTLHL